MRTALFTHPACLEHRPPVGHPERPERLQAVLEGLSGERFASLDRREAPRATADAIRLVHTEELIDAIAAGADISKAAAGRALDAAVGAITTAVSKGDSVTLVGFGSFKSAKRAARTGKNPKTGAAIKIPATTVPKFSAGASFKAAVAKKKK